MPSFRNKVLLLVITALWGSSCIQGQTTKEVNHNVHSWLGLFTTFRMGTHWGLTGDLLIRRNEFIKEPGFYNLRIGGGYWFTNSMSLTLAYGNLWNHQPQLIGAHFTHEHRFDQQFAVTHQLGKLSLLNRFRADARWRSVIENNQRTSRYYFTERIRVLNSLAIPLSPKPFVPALTITNEILVQFGKQVVYNTLDQFRFFVGIRQSLGQGWSFDAGYMAIYQQTAAGNVYNFNHTPRLLFYYVRPSNSTSRVNLQPSQDE
jgi:hypothetical protein